MLKELSIVLLLSFPALGIAELKTAGKWIYSEYRSDNNHGNFIALTSDEKSTAMVAVIANPDLDCTPLLLVTEEKDRDVGEGELNVDVELRIDTLGKWEAKDQKLMIFDARVELYIHPDDDWNLIRELVDGNVLRIRFGDWIGRFSLSGSERAISETLLRCNRYAERYGDKRYFDEPDQDVSDPDEQYF